MHNSFLMTIDLGRFGTGYTMMIKVGANADLQMVKNFVQSVFYGAILLEEHQVTISVLPSFSQAL